MVARTGDSTFFERRRARIVPLLPQPPQTVDGPANELALTDTAVRRHRGPPERDRLAAARGVRREGGVGKPATAYEIAADAEASFSNAYIPFLTTLLGALGDRMTATELRALMREVGRRL